MTEMIRESDAVQIQTTSLSSATAGGKAAPESFCPICGRDASDPSLKRFGEIFCSEAHVTEYARGIRSKRATETAAIATGAGADTTTLQTTGTSDVPQAPRKKRGIGGFLKMAACCGGMLLLVPALGLVSAGGLAAVAGSALSVAAVLACPLGMYFMMRMMMRHEKHPGAGGEADEARKEPPPSAPGSLV